jgi:hypothetical protein
MARQNPDGEKLSNPAELFLEWSGKHSCFLYWDKEKKERVKVKLPFTFIVLDSLHTLKGFNEKEEIGYFSNEIKNFKTQTFKVKSKNGVEWEGLYDSFKDAYKAKGGKYGHSVYVAIKDSEGKLMIANIFMSGSALAGGKKKEGKTVTEIGGWMDFVDKHQKDLYTKAVTISSAEQCTKGDNTYFVPIFKLVTVTEETDNEAGVLQEQVVSYIKEYLAKAQGNPAEEQELAKMVESAHVEAFGGTPSELTNKEEQIFGGAKEVIDAGPLGEMGELPSSVDDDSFDLPF